MANKSFLSKFGWDYRNRFFIFLHIRKSIRTQTLTISTSSQHTYMIASDILWKRFDFFLFFSFSLFFDFSSFLTFICLLSYDNCYCPVFGIIFIYMHKLNINFFIRIDWFYLLICFSFLLRISDLFALLLYSTFVRTRLFNWMELMTVMNFYNGLTLQSHTGHCEH